MSFQITDDSGFLALIDPDQYISFVDEDWEFDQLIAHFKEQMKEHNLLIWHTGREDIWNLKINNKITEQKGFREIIGQIKVKNKLCLVNYEDLTMAAQFKDEILPLNHNKDLIIPLEEGNYRCRIIQMSDPEDWETKPEFDFTIELEKNDNFRNVWSSIPWEE